MDHTNESSTLKGNVSTSVIVRETSHDGKYPVVVSETPRRTWASYLWDSFDKSPEERKFLFKLDSALLTFACLGYFIKYLDQTNLNNAFVSGMKEDLDLRGNQLNYMNLSWTIGYVIGEIPSNILLTRIRPSLWIPTVELAWSILTMATSRCNSARQIYIIRFFVGLFESAFYPGMQYIIGSWYRKDELAKRSVIFHTSAAVASMFSGYLMASVYHLGGIGGFAGWQWLFIVDGIISIPIALAGYFVIPDVPEITRAPYFSKEDVAFAQKRMSLEGRGNRSPYTWSKVKKILTSWHIYALTWLYLCFNNGNQGAAPVFAQYLKNHVHPKYSITQINVYPTLTFVVQIVTALSFAWASDSFLKGNRLPPIVLGGIVNIICYVSLAVWTIPDGWRWACYILAGTGYGLSGLIMAWAHEICSADNEERAIVVATMNEMAYVVQAWLPLLVWKQVEAPEYRKGFITAAGLSVSLVVTGYVTKWLHKREIKRNIAISSEGVDEHDSSDLSTPHDSEEVHMVAK